MKPNQFLVAVLCTATITGGALVSSIASAQACPLRAKLAATNSAGQSPQPFNSTTTGTSAAGIALIGGLLAVGGVYWSRRSRKSESVAHEAEYEVSEVPSTPVVEQLDSERELVGSRK